MINESLREKLWQFAPDSLVVVNHSTMIIHAVNPSYQNPELPASISIRKNLMEKIADRLTRPGKTVTIEFH